MNIGLSSGEIIGLQCTISVLGGGGLFGIAYALHIFRKAKKQLTALGREEYLVHGFDILGFSLPGFLMGVLTAVILLSAPDRPTLAIATLGITAMAAASWCTYMHGRAKRDYEEWLLAESEADKLGEAG
jgi:hypothetical protein